ncbi:MAG: hypothetical protein AB7K37_15300 [Cyclobacteriaceae bacterium]
MYRTRIIILLTLTLAGKLTLAQDLETIGKKDPLQLSGGLSLNQIFYGVNGIESRRDPYSYFLSGNLNLSLYGWSVPLSFAVSNQNQSFQQPFNQYGLHPTYKWATAHLGYASMTFSPYTLSGHIFRGAGVELKPEKFTFSAMYGQLRRAVEADTLRNTTPAYERNGFGFKTGYRSGGDVAEVSMFYGKDEESSLRMLPQDKPPLPEENLVLGISLGKQVLERFSVMVDYASSALTRDMRDESGAVDNLFSKLGFDGNASTSFYDAWKASLSYQNQQTSVGVAYERIDPGYRTHGAYYFNNDLENFTINASSMLLDARLSVGASVGVQRDNLDNSKMSTMNRAVGSINASLSATERLSVNLNYSNFQSYTNIRSQFVNINQLTPYDNLDTLQFTQIAQNLNLGANYILSQNREKQQTILVNFSVQDAAERQGQVSENSGSRFYNVNASYSVNFVPRNLMLMFAYNLNENQSPLIQVLTHGPTASLNKSLLDRKMRLSLAASHNMTSAQGNSLSRIVNVRTSAGYVAKKQHHFSVGLTALNRTTGGEKGDTTFTEFTGTVTYSYSFSR